MNRIKKAILAFAIFGFFGGCEAAQTLKVINAPKHFSQTSNQLYYVDVNNVGDAIVLKEKVTDRNGVTSYPIRDNWFTYDSRYNELIKKFLSGQHGVKSQDALCKSLLRFFLLDTKDTLDDVYDVNGRLFALRNEVKAAFFWHIAKHYVTCNEKRHSNGAFHTLTELPNRQLKGPGLTIGEIKLSQETISKVESIIDKAIKYYNFRFNNDTIEVTPNIINRQISRNILTELGASVSRCRIQNGTIDYNQQTRLNINNIINVFFEFRLPAIAVNRYNLVELDRITGEGTLGSFFFTL